MHPLRNHEFRAVDHGRHGIRARIHGERSCRSMIPAATSSAERQLAARACRTRVPIHAARARALAKRAPLTLVLREDARSQPEARRVRLFNGVVEIARSSDLHEWPEDLVAFILHAKSIEFDRSWCEKEAFAIER